MAQPRTNNVMPGFGNVGGSNQILNADMIRSLMGGGGMMPDMMPSLPSIFAQTATAQQNHGDTKFAFANHMRKNQTTAAETANKSAKNLERASLAIDPTTAWLYCALWYLIQQFVRNNTTNDLILMRPPGSVAVADNLRSTFWWIVMFGAICWICLACVTLFLEHYTYDIGAVSTIMTRLFST